MAKYSLSIILLFFSFTIVAQRHAGNSGNDNFGKYEKTQIEYLNELYSVNIDPSYELINGREYFPYYYRSKRKPILFIEKKHSSSITLKKRKYDDINLDYDIFSDDVIYVDSTRVNIYLPLRVALNKDNIDCFTLCFGTDTMTFRYFDRSTDTTFDLENGFYEMVLDSNIKYIIKHKSIALKTDGINEYNNTHIGYVNIGNGYSRITTKKEFIKLFGDRRAEIKSIIKRSKINIRRADKTQIANVLKLYDIPGSPRN